MQITQLDDTVVMKLTNAAGLSRELRLAAVADLEAGRKVNLIYQYAGAMEAIGSLKPERGGQVAFFSQRSRTTYDNARDALRGAATYVEQFIERQANPDKWDHR